MSNNLFDISLNQGKQFNNYQTKIKRSVTKNMPKSRTRTIKEGFVTSEQEKMVRPKDDGYTSVLENQERGTRLVNSVNQKDVDELQQLQAKYNDLIQQYTSIQKSIGDSSLATIDRLSGNNPYLNKSIRFTTGHVCYVTAEGIVKYIPSPDIWNSTIAPKSYIDINLPWLDSYSTPGTTIPTNPPLISGTFVKMNESLGNEGKNVYASKLINNPTSDYVGCYNDKPAATDINVVPIMGSTNEVNGFGASASSVYQNNNDFAGPWCAFDNNVNTWWHSSLDSGFTYDSTTGQYKGNSSLNIIDSNGQSINVPGEWLQIVFPTVNTITKYSIQGRQDCCGQPNGRDPNTWYIVGLKDNQWYWVDYQTNISFNWNMLSFNIANPQPYISYAIVTTVVGDSKAVGTRNCLQIATWNLIVSSDSTMSDDKRAMIWNPTTIGYTSLDSCQQFAVDNGYQYFGMQDYQSNGTAACLVSNDITKTTAYGDASVQVSGYPIWASNTSAGQTAQLAGTGQLSIQSNTGVILNIGDEVNGCQNWGTITVTSATYGGNCKTPIGNVTGQVGQQPGVVQPVACNWTDSCSIPISNQTFGDPAPGCPKSFDIEYTCGGTPFTTNIPYAEGQTMIVNCRDHMNENCQFFLILQDDGNMCIYKGTDPSNNKGAVWCTMTNGKQKSPNPDWVSSKGKFGRNYLKLGEGLATNEWIGSTDGSLKLIMQTDGNLVLYTSETKSGCVKGQNDKTYGGGWVNAVYKINAAGNQATLGKVGYIDSDSSLREYPDSMLGYTNNYQIYKNTDSAGNDMTGILVPDENTCQTACNNTANCSAYVYQASSTGCWLKNSNAFPKGEKQPLSGVNLGVRKRGLTGSTTCSNQIVDVDTVQYDNYNKGDGMSPDTQCNVSLVSQADRIQFDNIKNQLATLGQDIASKMENLYNQDNKVYEKLNMNSQQFKKDLEKYKTINLQIRQELEIQSNNNIEGMTNFKLNMNDINGMLSDTDLRVLQGNYSYIMWSILAVGILTITINTMKK
jgi:hypothetical protein